MEDEIHRRFARRIEELSRRRKIAITYLPDHAGVSRAHFWNVMKGRRSPTLRWIARLATALEVDPSELIAPDRLSAKGRRAHRP